MLIGDAARLADLDAPEHLQAARRDTPPRGHGLYGQKPETAFTPAAAHSSELPDSDSRTTLASTTTSVTQWPSNGQPRGDARRKTGTRPLRSTAGDHMGSCRTRTLPLDATARRLGHRLRSRVSISEVTRWRSSMVLGTCRTMSMSGCSTGRNWNISRSSRPISG